MYISFKKSVIIHNKYNTKVICNTILQILLQSFCTTLLFIFFHFNACALFVFELSTVLEKHKESIHERQGYSRKLKREKKINS